MEYDKKTVALALLLLFGSGSGIVNTFVPQIRSDAFPRSVFDDIGVTKEQLNEAIREVIEIDEAKMDILRYRITKLEQQTIECNRRIDKCEEK